MGRAARFDVPSEGNRVNVSFLPKGDDRCVVTVTHVKLDGPYDVDGHRLAWRARLARLAAGGTPAAVTRSAAGAS